MSSKVPILLIPLCGIGQRFIDSGNTEYKALIDINGKNMLTRIFSKFPNSISIFLITTKAIKSKVEANLEKSIYSHKINFIVIEPHKLGPAYSIYKALNYIPDKNPIYISYCDILWNWEYGFPFDLQIKSKAVIFVHKGFHPHLIKNSFSAFCKADQSNFRLLEIKEKGSFTNKWMDEILSIGLFYIRKKDILEIGIKALIDSKNIVCGEYYPSIIFNFLIKKNIQVDLYYVKGFVHYGTPEHLNDFIFWQNHFSKNIKILKYKQTNYKNIILAAGLGSRMKEISDKQKPFIKLEKKFLINKLFEELPLSEQDSKVIINNSFPIEKNFYNCEFKIKKINSTNSQLETLFNISEDIVNLKNFFLCSCDCFGNINSNLLSKYINKNIFDYICFGFKPTLLQKKINGHTYFTPKKNKVIKVHIKSRKYENDLGLAGFFWIKDGLELYNYIEYVKKNKKSSRELIIDDVISQIVFSKQKVGWIKLETYFHLGSAEEFKEYNYWKDNLEFLNSKYE